MKDSGFIRCSYVGWRFLRYRFSPWLVLAIAPFKLVCSSGTNRHSEKVRAIEAMSRIDFAGFCELINDLLW